MEEEEDNWKGMFYSIWKREGNNFIQFLLDAGLDVNALNKYGKTILSYAAEWGNLEITEFLVERGANGDVKNSDGSKPLHIAAQHGRKDIVKFFLGKGISANSCDNNINTPLHCVGYSDISSVGIESCEQIVQFLLDSNAHIDAVNREGDTPLLLAAKESCKPIVELLINLGANVNFRNGYRWTILHYACLQGWLDIVKYLVNAGCDFNAKVYLGQTPVVVAADFSHSSVVEYLIDSGANLEYARRDGMLHYACDKGWLDVIKSLIKRGFDLNARDANRDTPLHYAVCAQRTVIVKYLLEAGAGWDLQNKDQLTAFNLCFRGPWYYSPRLYLEGIVLFIENGAYFRPDDYNAIVKQPSLKEGILQNVSLCTQAVVNQFNNAELPKVYEIPVVAERLPSIEKLKIASQGNVAQDIAKCVEFEMQTKGYCDLLNVRPNVLSCLCLRCLVEYYDN